MFPRLGEHRRQDDGHSVDAHRYSRPHFFHLHDEHRPGAAGPAEHGGLDRLRLGNRESEPAGLHRTRRRRRPLRLAKPAFGVPARQLPGNPNQYQQHEHREAHREHQELLRDQRRAAFAIGPGGKAEQAIRDGPGARSPHSVVRVGLPDADRSDRRLRYQPRAGIHSQAIRGRHAAGPANADRAAVAGKRGARGAGLAPRLGPSPGHQQRAAEEGRTNATDRWRRC